MKTTCRNTSPRFSFLSSSFHIARLPTELFHTAIITRVRFTPISNETHCFFFFLWLLLLLLLLLLFIRFFFFFRFPKSNFPASKPKNKMNESNGRHDTLLICIHPALTLKNISATTLIQSPSGTVTAHNSISKKRLQNGGLLPNSLAHSAPFRAQTSISTN